MNEPRDVMSRVDAHLVAVRLSAEADARILDGMRARRREATSRRGVLAMLALAAGIVLAIAIARSWEPHAEPRAMPRVREQVAAAFGIATPVEGCVRELDGATVSLTGHCRTTFDRPRVVVDTWDSATIAREGGALRLVSGWATFDVAPTRRDAPVRVLVSAGAIEVLGTRFAVYESDEGGHVDLIEGRIRFLDRDGGVTAVEPGLRHAWTGGRSVVAARELDSVSAENEPTVEPPATTAHAPDAEAATSRGVQRSRARPSSPRDSRVAPLPLERIAALRSSGRYADAVALIDGIDSRGLDSRSAEALSYEKGTILQDQLEHTADACAHWGRHATRFPAGRYLDSVRARIEALGCAGT